MVGRNPHNPAMKASDRGRRDSHTLIFKHTTDSTKSGLKPKVNRGKDRRPCLRVYHSSYESLLLWVKGKHSVLKIEGCRGKL